MIAQRMVFLFFLCLISFSCVAQENQKFYLGFSTGMGSVFSSVDKEIAPSQKRGFANPSEVSLNYHLSDSWILQFNMGLHVKHYRASADRFYTNSYPVLPQANFAAWNSKMTTGLNLLFRKPFNDNKKVYWGLNVGYGINWKHQPWGGKSISAKECDDPRTHFLFNDFDPNYCKYVLEVNYDFSGRGNHYYLLGLITDIVLPSKKSEDQNLLRLSIVSRTGRGFPTPLTGSMTFYEEGEVIEEVDFRSNGSTLSFEVAYLLPL